MQHRTSQAHRAWWFPAVALAIVVALTWAPVYAAGVSAASSEPAAGTTSPALDVSRSALAPEAESAAATVKFADAQVAAQSATLVSSLPKRSAALPAAKTPARATYNPRTASAPRATTVARRTTTRTTPTATVRATSTSELSQARAILRSLIAAHPILAGSTVSIGATPGGYQAVCYYKSGRILISPTHTASLRTILNHEAWHIIDWRDNGHIDWGEAVPR